MRYTLYEYKRVIRQLSTCESNIEKSREKIMIHLDKSISEKKNHSKQSWFIKISSYNYKNSRSW